MVRNRGAGRLSKPLDVAFVLPDLGGGGAQKVMLAVAGGLDPARFSARLLVLGGSQAFAAQVPTGLETDLGGATRLREGMPWALKRLRALKPDVVVSVMGYLNLALLAARPALGHARIVVREANVVAATTSALPRWMPSRALYALLYPAAAAIVSPTAPIADEIARAAPLARRKISVVPNPVAVEALRERAGRPFRQPGAGLRLVSAGRLTRQKGYDRLLELMGMLPSDAELTIYGEGPDRGMLEARIEVLGLTERVTLPGFSRELPAQIAGADAFVLPSRWEGLPNVVLESLALGTPVVASDEAAVAEIAAAAPRGAVTICPVDQRFAAALRAMPIGGQGRDAARPSLLPEAYLDAAVIARWQDLLASLAPV